jgi:cellulose synthase/poly-beta-1,6-N-acetylglucosamine synthase-like glycosyltransferase
LSPARGLKHLSLSSDVDAAAGFRRAQLLAPIYVMPPVYDETTVLFILVYMCKNLYYPEPYKAWPQYVAMSNETKSSMN